MDTALPSISHAGTSRMNAEWYYIGHYGELGPLTLEQMEELIRDGVIDRETYVWRQGMADWVHAVGRQELLAFFGTAPSLSLPPPPPVPSRPLAPISSSLPHGQRWLPVEAPRSDRNRWIAGLLQLVLPGTGRMYLGYVAQGVVQLFLFPFGCGIGWLWSVIDGIYILLGGVKLDGYGRKIDD